MTSTPSIPEAEVEDDDLGCFRAAIISAASPVSASRRRSCVRGGSWRARGVDLRLVVDDQHASFGHAVGRRS